MFWCKIVGGQLIVPEHIWSKEDAHTFTNNPPVFTGPYELYKVYPDNKVFVWVRNEDYWGKAIGNFPEAKYAIYRTGPGAEQQLAEVKENNMDIFGLAYDTWKTNQADIPQINQVVYADPCPRAAWFNTASNEHLAKPGVPPRDVDVDEPREVGRQHLDATVGPRQGPLGDVQEPR